MDDPIRAPYSSEPGYELSRYPMISRRIGLWFLPSVLLCLLSFDTASAREGPGFDCAKAHQALAQIICADDDLSLIDLRLNQVYSAYRRSLTSEAKRNLDKEEVAFIQSVIATCKIPELAKDAGYIFEGTDDISEQRQCIAKFYKGRIAILQTWSRSTGAAIDTTLPAQQGPSLSTPATAVAKTVQLEHQHGVFMVPVRINDAVTIPFVLDSGAGDVSVPEDVFKTLLRTRTVRESDFLSPGTYILADGSKQSNQRFTLHELRVGDYVVKDVVASVAPDKADPLLGQSFLGKLPGWAIDNTQHTLVIGTGGEGGRPQAALTAPASPATAPTKNILAADVLRAQSAIGAVLQRNTGGLATKRSSCPSRDISDRANDGWEFVTGTQAAPIDETSNAILIDSNMCNGGNGHGQYLVISQKGSTRIITDAEIADMSFLGSSIRVEGTSVFLTGVRWGTDDPHCCPSNKATLQYDIRTGQHKFILVKRLQNGEPW